MFQVHWCNRASSTRLLSPRSNFLSFFQRGDSEPGSLMAPVRDEQTKLTAVQPYHRISRPLNSNSEQTKTSAWCMCPGQHDYEGLFHRLEGWRVYALDLDTHFGVSRLQNNPDFTSHSYFNQVSRISCTHYSTAATASQLLRIALVMTVLITPTNITPPPLPIDPPLSRTTVKT